MKKLMIAAAAAFCGTVVFGLESANIVGYMENNKTVAGLNLLAPGFVDVGLTSIKLTGLKVTNASGGEVTSGNCLVSLIDDLGNATKIYTWASSGRNNNKTWGWKEGTAVIDDKVVFGRGVGLLFTAESDGDVLSSFGEANLSAISFGETAAGLNVIANPYPTTVTLKALTVTNKDGGEVTSGNCLVSLIDDLGNATKIYTWASSGRNNNKTWGWKEGTAAIDDTVVLEPGQAILFTAETAGDKLIFPSKE